MLTLIFSQSGTTGPEVTEPITDNLTLRYKADVNNVILEDTDRVTQWNDISGNGYHATIASASAARPKFITVAGVPQIRFNGNYYMDIPAGAVLDTQSCSIFVVAKPDSLEVDSSNHKFLLKFNGSSGNTNFFLFNDTNTHYLKFRNVSSNLRWGSSLMCYHVSGDATQTDFQVGAQSETLAAATATTSSLVSTLGAQSTVPANAWTGEIMEILVYDTKKSAADTATILTYLENEWGCVAQKEKKLYILEGDSLTEGASTPNEAWHEQFARNHFTTQPKILSFAIGGRLQTEIDTDYATEVSPEVGLNSDYTIKHAINWAGTNDCSGTTPTVATITAALDSWVTKAKADGLTTWVCTLIDRSDHDAAELARVAEYNQHILDGNSGADHIIDLAADPRLQNADDLTYFNPDAIHLNATGAAVVAEIIAARVEGGGFHENLVMALFNELYFNDDDD